jgi:hypothetical protein
MFFRRGPSVVPRQLGTIQAMYSRSVVALQHRRRPIHRSCLVRSDIIYGYLRQVENLMKRGRMGENIGKLILKGRQPRSRTPVPWGRAHRFLSRARGDRARPKFRPDRRVIQGGRNRLAGRRAARTGVGDRAGLHECVHVESAGTSSASAPLRSRSRIHARSCALPSQQTPTPLSWLTTKRKSKPSLADP